MGNPVVHVELLGPDPSALQTFYGALFGWDQPPGAPVAPPISEASSYAFIDAAEGAAPAAAGIGGGPGFVAHAVFYVGVADVRAALQQAESLGGTVVLPLQVNEGTGIRVGHFRDPAGNLVGVAGPA
ncbi:VOC family protein [uncultured Amnibacterium sp.]|uniref:VOC family protein n=1 Tax=uncultured Amnibacterium sp. TaxID=1631851 RepID=UPI0035CC49CA